MTPTMSKIHDLIIKYCEDNKVDGIRYEDSLESIDELLDEIKKDYNKIINDEEDIEII